MATVSEQAPQYDFAVIGSGFGGSVAALRLSQKGYSVLLIEEGRRWNGSVFCNPFAELTNAITSHPPSGANAEGLAVAEVAARLTPRRRSRSAQLPLGRSTSPVACWTQTMSPPWVAAARA